MKGKLRRELDQQSDLTPGRLFAPADIEAKAGLGNEHISKLRAEVGGLLQV